MLNRVFRPALWGVSVALSWTWGLGLFFSVQIALLFGLGGLLSFAIPNALGLILFGLLTQNIADKHPDGKEFERHFLRTGYSLRFIFLLYQLVAITLTFFAVFKYLFLPLGSNLLLAVLLVFGITLLMGEQFDIRRIKWSHLTMFVVIVLAGCGVAWGLNGVLAGRGLQAALAPGEKPLLSGMFVGYLIPMIAGLFVGPWLDIQQWHRAIQIHREHTSVRVSYLFGAIIFFAILIFHGTLALIVMSVDGGALVVPAADGLFHAKDYVVRFMLAPEYSVGLLFKVSYIIFIFLCILSTLDSGYVSLKWYVTDIVRKSEHVVMTLVPENALRSPVLSMLVAVVFAAVAVPLRLEIEYFMSFYASFFVGYAVVFLFRSAYKPQFANFTHTTLFSVAAFSLGLFGIGYFDSHWYLMVLGALAPLIHGLVVISGRVVVDDLQKALPRPDSTDEAPLPSVSGKAAEMALHALENAISRLNPKTGDKVKEIIHRIEPGAAHALASILSSITPAEGEQFTLAKPIDTDAEIEHARGHFEGKWYSYTFMATYQDTNSVGNIYFGQYVLWVGKVREMFFQACMPGFDLKKTSFFILTRSIEHKFNLEGREFDLITVKIRIESFNRKFVTLEHQILNQAKQIMGKGRQILMFVNAKDYSLVDLPNELRVAFLPYA